MSIPINSFVNYLSEQGEETGYILTLDEQNRVCVIILLSQSFFGCCYIAVDSKLVNTVDEETISMRKKEQLQHKALEATSGAHRCNNVHCPLKFRYAESISKPKETSLQELVLRVEILEKELFNRKQKK